MLKSHTKTVSNPLVYMVIVDVGSVDNSTQNMVEIQVTISKIRYCKQDNGRQFVRILSDIILQFHQVGFLRQTYFGPFLQ